MFGKFGQFLGMMKNLPRISQEAEALKQRLAEITAEGDAGAGMVKVRVNGRMEILNFTLSDELVQGQDREMLEDLLKAATNQALQKVRAQIAEETQKMAMNLGLPAGMNLPGMPGMEQAGEGDGNAGT
jgi:DNA-binding YbaB/EbfC family protein